MKTIAALSAWLALGLLVSSPASAMDPVARASVQTSKVRANTEKRIFRSWYINEACEPLRGFEIAVEALPAHGTVRLAKVSEQVDDTWLGNRPSPGRIRRIADCKGKTTQAIHVLYTPRRDFVGADKVVISILSAEKVQKRLVTINLTVR